ncbi:MAG: substrate-binding domain-containing protein [Acidobacteria bacterium]|nr:substrate-binding domain-containing protein [Acidobacteriota bacterium]
MRRVLPSLLAATLLWAQGPQLQYVPKADPSLPRYQPGTALEEILEATGTDGMTDVWEEWKQAFSAFHPQAKYRVNHTLTKTAIEAMMQGKSQLIYLAREMSIDEIQAFERKFGYTPTKIIACYDAFIVFVNGGNPLKDISMEQLDALLSTTRKVGHPTSIDTWGDLDVRGALARRPINVYIRAEGTATRAVLKDLLLLKGTFKAGLLDRPDFPSIADAVVTDAAGIGIAGLAHWYSRNRTLAVAPPQSRSALMPSQDNVTSGRYPLARTYYFYLNRPPGKSLPAPIQEFLQFLLSLDGQQAVAVASLYPVPAEIIQANRRRIRN